ncbi:MAG: hypothetical protein IJA86_01615 [Clostridia bacterium]|nr:hypothetical protein [Clostridia bacterium]
MDSNFTETKENVLAGAVGAFLFSLVGGILWFVIYQFGYLAAISGLIGVICAVKGYTFFAKIKTESNKCLVISTVISIAVLVIAWYLCVAYDIYLVYQEGYAAGEVDFTYTFFESVQVVPYFFQESEVLIAYLKDLGMGLLFAVLGIVSYLASREKKKKQQAAMEAAREAAKAAAEAEKVTDETTEETANSTVEQ